MAETKNIHGELYVFNPTTHYWVKASTRLGKKLIGSDVCAIQPPMPGRGEFIPLPHQKRVADAFMRSNYRGIALVHQLGVGKSCSYILIADRWIEANPGKKVVVVTMGSLRENFLSQYCNFCGKNTKDLLDRFIFVTMNNTNVMKTLPSLDHCLIIVDEVHHLLNAKSNESVIGEDLYDTIDHSVGSRIVVGSGTPVINSIEQLYYLLRLINPKAFKGTIDQFTSLWTPSSDGVMKPTHEKSMIALFQGTIDYVKTVENAASSDFPKVTHRNIYVPINTFDKEHLNLILDEVSNENRAFLPSAAKPNYEQAKIGYFIKKMRIRSRQVANFMYPGVEGSYLLLDREPRGDRLPDKLQSDGGWIPKSITQGYLPVHGEKIARMIHEIQRTRGKHAVYSSFKTRSGEWLVGAILKSVGISYVTFDGDMNDDERATTLADFNSSANLHGEKIKVILFTEAGAEGISLFDVRVLHILEQSVMEWVIQQVMGRVARFRSHQRLPSSEQSVTILRYFLDIETSFPNYPNNKWSPDFLTYQRGHEKQTSIRYVVETFLPKFKI